MAKTGWLRLVGYVSGLVNQKLLLKNEFLLAENRILKSHIKGRLLLSDGEKTTLAEIAKRLGRKALTEVSCVVKPDTILAWYRKLVAKKFNGSKQRAALGRPRIGRELEDLVVQLAQSNPGWGYDRIVGALAHLGHSVSDQSVGNILRRGAYRPQPNAGKTRLVKTSSTRDGAWMDQAGRNGTSESWGLFPQNEEIIGSRTGPRPLPRKIRRAPVNITTMTPHELFDHTGILKSSARFDQSLVRRPRATRNPTTAATASDCPG